MWFWLSSAARHCPGSGPRTEVIFLVTAITRGQANVRQIAAGHDPLRARTPSAVAAREASIHPDGTVGTGGATQADQFRTR